MKKRRFMTVMAMLFLTVCLFAGCGFGNKSNDGTSNGAETHESGSSENGTVTPDKNNVQNGNQNGTQNGTLGTDGENGMIGTDGNNINGTSDGNGTNGTNGTNGANGNGDGVLNDLGNDVSKAIDDVGTDISRGVQDMTR